MHQPNKRLGQHFLHNKTTIGNIVHAIHPQPEDNMVEIGPGLGALTLELLPSVNKLQVIEIDDNLIAPLTQKQASYPGLIIHHADALEFNYAQLGATEKKLRVVGNLPYNISTPLIFHLLNHINIIADMHFMLQKEVVERIVAAPASADYGRLSVMTQYYCDAELLFLVDPEDFIPPPKVDSAILRLIPRPISPVAKNINHLSFIVQQAFNQRRKTLRNSLKNIIPAEKLMELNIDPQKRPEQLTVAEFVKISNSIRLLS